MVRFATAQLRMGHLPLTSWFPYLGLGSPQFLHYQSLPAMLTGAAGLVLGPDVAFRWSLYLLLSLWPVSVYLGARLLGGGRAGAAAAAAMAPFLSSVPGVGYEQKAYLWIGFGVWTQLWASWTLPLAWGLSWRAIQRAEGRAFAAAAAAVALTCALHFETGYLALVPLPVMALLAGRPILARLRSAAVLMAGSLLAAAWVILPLLAQRNWAARNEALQGTPLVDGYGAGKVMSWLVRGQLLDHGRLPVLSVLAATGLAVALVRRRRDPDSRVLLGLLACCLVLSFGRTTFGSLVDVLPGSGDIFFRRFMMGIQLVCLLLAGRGAVWGACRAWTALDRLAVRRGLGSPAIAPSAGCLRLLAGLVAMGAVLAPAWLQLGSYDSANAAAISAQRRADATQGVQLDALIAVIKHEGGGRAYAGLPTNWGSAFTVGQVQVFKYLESQDVDEVGYTLRTASLMSGPETYFQEGDPADYRLFGIRYLILPGGRRPPIAARLLLRAGDYALWGTGVSGYLQTGTLVETQNADRTDLGARSIPLLHSELASQGGYVRIAYGRPGPARALALPAAGGAPGAVLHEHDDLERGTVSATVRLRRPGIVVLSASYDPGWRAGVDGSGQSGEIIAPALVAVRVPAGRHTVSFHYVGYGGYPELFALAALTLLVLRLMRHRLGPELLSDANEAGSRCRSS